jgi:hypothetical protein
MRCSPAATERKTPSLKPRSGRDCVSQGGSGQFEHRRIGRAFEPDGKRLQLLVFDHCHASGRRVSRVANRMS